MGRREAFLVKGFRQAQPTSSAAAFAPKYVRFDGTSDYLSKSTGSPPVLSGAADGVFWTCAFAIKFKVNDTTQRIVQTLGPSLSILRIAAGNSFRLSLHDSTSSVYTTPSLTVIAPTVVDTTYLVHASGNWATCNVWRNGTQIYTDTPLSAATGDCDFSTMTDMFIGATNTATFLANAEVGFFYFVGGSDSSYEVTDPAKFYDSVTGDYKDLGTDGTLTGAPAPLVFFGCRQAAAAWNAGTNQGSGGNFTMTGAVADV